MYQGKKDKLRTLLGIIKDDSLSDCAYFGDDILDLKCMQPIKEAGGIIGCPSNAVEQIKCMSDYVCDNRAGEGALREFVEWLVAPKSDANDVEKRVQEAVEYIANLEHDKLTVGKYSIDDDFYFIVQEYLTRPAEECILESHRKYVDIQWIVKGTEAMDIANTTTLVKTQSYDKEKDIIFWSVPQNMMRTVLKEGAYVVLYPENAHRGCVQIGGSEIVKKIVGKVRIIK